MFKEDTKQFYEYSRGKTVGTKGHTHIQKVEIYWKSLWRKCPT